jgi:hypothetical protein
MSRPCYWVKDNDVPGGRFLVPGCYNRAIWGDHADCHCADRGVTVTDRLNDLEETVSKLKKEMLRMKRKIEERSDTTDQQVDPSA